MRHLTSVVLTLTLASSSFAADEYPLSKERRDEISKELADKISKATTSIQADAKDINAYSSRADAYFFQAEFAKSVADYEKMVELNPNLAASHWRRGIAYFYNKQFKKAANQFEMYHTFDDVDRENGIWRYFSQYKAYGKAKAQEGLLKYKKTDRQPFPSVYKLFSGKMTPKQILDEIAAAEISDDEREKRLFYAELYIGLNAGLEESGKAAARSHLRKSTANKWGPRAGFGPNYMWHVGRLHYELTSKKADPKK